MFVVVHLKETSRKLSYGMAENTYVKGPFYCVYFKDDTGAKYVHKFPIADIWRVEESYDSHTLEHG